VIKSRIQKEKIFGDFINKLKNERRYFCQHDFLNLLDESFERYFERIDINEKLYRARRMSKDEYEERKSTLIDNDPFQGFDKKNSFIPPVKSIRANRVNTNGILCLYTARSIKTAIAEVRPFKETFVSVATIQLNRPLKLFKFSLPKNISSLGEEIFWDKFPFWYVMLTNMFSVPYEFTNNDEYLVTQCISEYIRLSDKFDGILYKSSLDDDGENIAILKFINRKYTLCEPIKSEVYKINGVKVDYEGFNGKL
jgi:hypothetical protein